MHSELTAAEFGVVVFFTVCLSTSLSKNFIVMGVSIMRYLSLSLDFFGTGMILVVLKHERVELHYYYF